MYVCAAVNADKHTYMHTYRHKCACARMHNICTHICKCLNKYKQINTYLYIYIYRKNVYTHIHVYTYIHISLFTDVFNFLVVIILYICKYTYIFYICICVCARICANMYACICANTAVALVEEQVLLACLCCGFEKTANELRSQSYPLREFVIIPYFYTIPRTSMRALQVPQNRDPSTLGRKREVQRGLLELPDPPQVPLQGLLRTCGGRF